MWYIVQQVVQGLRERLTPPAYTLAQGRIKKLKVKGAEGGGPWFGATSDLTMPRAPCAKLSALCCDVCLLAMSRSDWQHGYNLRGENMMRTERGQSSKTRSHVRTGTSYLILQQQWRVIPTILMLYVRSKARRIRAQHGAAGQGTAPYGTARRCAC